MNRSMRILDTGLMWARRNVAFTAAMLELHRAGRVPDTFRLHVYPRSVLVGRDQRLAAAVQLQACRRNHVEVARRLTEGHAVYMSPGVLAWEVVADAGRFGERAADASERTCRGIAAGLARFGLSARFRPPNEVEIDGRRIARVSGGMGGSTVLVQGWIAIDLDVAEMAAVLRPPSALRAVGASAAATSRASRLTELSEWLGRIPSYDELNGLLAAGAAQCWGCELRAAEPTPEEVHLVDRLLEQGMGSDAFVETPFDTMPDGIASIARAYHAACPS